MRTADYATSSLRFPPSARSRYAIPMCRAFSLCIVLCLGLLAGCSSSPPQPDPATTAADATRSYNDGVQLLLSGDYVGAKRRLDPLDSSGGGGRSAKEAVIEAARTAVERSMTLDHAQTFIDAQANNPPGNAADGAAAVEYALYLRGLVSYFQALPLLTSAQTPQSWPPAASMGRRAFQQLAELVKAHPKGRFADDSTRRLIDLRNALAQQEMDIVKYHLLQGEVSAAVTRARYVVENYQNTTAVVEAQQIVNRLGTITPTAKPTPTAVAEQPAPIVPSVPSPERIIEKAAPPVPPSTPPATAKSSKPAAPTPSRRPVTGIQRASWLLKQSPTLYSIQLANLPSEKSAKAFITRRSLRTDVAYFRVRRNGRPTYSIVHGLYSSHEDAQRAAVRLARQLKITKPWVRRLSAIQAQIRGE